ncbi:MAG TPA: sulfide/dihydroorotate dehydrogenase-like FAD/NAD-binding protein [Thermoplasmatales archaeon]|nr:sulfide/dihydroorotate dehydrogenase-like FAD/NAD-binding protein [Thermoplasmatales archaeon]
MVECFNTYKIIDKKILGENLKQIEVSAPLVAKHAQPGQFVIVMVDEKGERIPITIADYDRQKGTITLIFLEIGKTTKKLGSLDVGDTLYSFCGPLGKPSAIKNYGNVICIGGGVGVASLYPIVRALKEKRNRVISILGARSKHLLIMEDEIDRYSDELIITTDDGSKGKRGFVSDALRDLLERNEKIDMVMAVGPILMMKAICDITRPYKIKTLVNLNPIMLCGMGMCGCCRVIVGGEVKFACVDGPEFDGHEVDFDTLCKRNQSFVEEEGVALKKYLQEAWQVEV